MTMIFKMFLLFCFEETWQYSFLDSIMSPSIMICYISETREVLKNNASSHFFCYFMCVCVCFSAPAVLMRLIIVLLFFRITPILESFAIILGIKVVDTISDK
ncbi:hypothetical protein TorRG33x02_039760 [Trema orientale]|uniref:Uncharacterized protein n=1 Tax=Trema orientale TaxID=63057 RepID=A0A2P5FQX1_TREOI|nr:hypothetical protein TorRG33x02_039760 [Trema orientale]